MRLVGARAVVILRPRWLIDSRTTVKVESPIQDEGWKEAAADFFKAIELEPENHWNYFVLGPLLVQRGDLEAYHRLCAQIRTRFGGTTNDPSIADVLAKACLILPSPGADLSTESKLADVAVTVGKGNKFEAYFQFTKGLAEYRQGHFGSAADWASRSRATTNSWNGLQVAACMVLAMSRHQLNQTDEARVALSKGAEISQTQLPELQSGDIGRQWFDWLIAHILMREAEALIEDQPPQTPRGK